MIEDQLSFLRRYLPGRSERWTTIAEQSGVSRRAIAYIANDADRDARYSTVAALIDWVREHDPEAFGHG